MYYDWRPYVPVAVRRRRAEREMQKLRKSGQKASPVTIEGRAIVSTFWGRAWCENLERYSDFANRLPRGRTYVRNGSVADLQIAPGKVKALVIGSEVYRTTVSVSPLPKARWLSICADCAGSIDSLVELLQGRFSKGVMQRICQEQKGLFPAPSEIEFSCSCPDWASMCKHVAAVLYGVGARLDQQPELLFRLREVDEKDLIAQAGKGLPLAKQGPAADRKLGTDDLSELFGLEMARSSEEAKPDATPCPAKARETRRRTKAAAKPEKQAGSVSHRGKRPAATIKLKPKAGKQAPKRGSKTEAPKATTYRG